jgi:hypothetical protein
MLVRSGFWLLQYQLSVLNMESVAAKLATDMAGDAEDPRCVTKWANSIGLSSAIRFLRIAREALERHRERGRFDRAADERDALRG